MMAPPLKEPEGYTLWKVRKEIAENALYAMLRGGVFNTAQNKPANIVDIAFEMADRFMEKAGEK